MPPESTPAADAADEPGTTIASTGVMKIGAPTAVAMGTALPTLVGGSLSLVASDIEDSGAIVAPSGVITLSSAGNLHLSSTASIDAAGTTIQVVDQSAPSPGGFVMLNAGGNVTLDAGSSISVAGSSRAAHRLRRAASISRGPMASSPCPVRSTAPAMAVPAAA